MVRNSNTLYNLAAVLDRVNPRQQDVVVLHLRVLGRAGAGEAANSRRRIFSASTSKSLFTRALVIGGEERQVHSSGGCARHGKVGGHPARCAELAVLHDRAGSVSWTTGDGGGAHRRPGVGGAAGTEAQLTLEIYSPGGQEHVFYLGPHAPRLTPKEIDLLHGIWLELSSEVAPEELHHHDVIHFALLELRQNLSSADRESVLRRLRLHLEEIKDRRASSP